MSTSFEFQFSHDLVSVFPSVIEEGEDEEIEEALHHSFADGSCHSFTGELSRFDIIEFQYKRLLRGHRI